MDLKFNINKVLICDALHYEGIKRLKDNGFEVDVKPKISTEELKNIIINYNVIIVRSRTKVTNEIIKIGKNLKVIGRAGAGLDNIDVKTAEEMGTRVETISVDTTRGEQLKELGSIAGILRYKTEG